MLMTISNECRDVRNFLTVIKLLRNNCIILFYELRINFIGLENRDNISAEASGGEPKDESKFL